ncbi:glucosaminidase domain-containing protein [Staphylococcus simulans]
MAYKNNRINKSISLLLKVICSTSLTLSTCIAIDPHSQQDVAEASNLPVIDTQQGCSPSDAGVTTAEDDISPKHQNINMKKYKETFEKNAKGGKLEGKSDTILKIAEEEKVPPLLMIAIIVNESGWGTGANAMRQNNPLSVMGNQSIEESTYDTIEEGLRAGAKNLYEGYIKEGLDTPKKIGPKYAPIGAANDENNMNVNWIPNNEAVMKELGAEGMESSSEESEEESSDEASKDKEESSEGESKEESSEEGASAADTDNDTEVRDPCGEEEKDENKSDGKPIEKGKSVKPNGKSGRLLEGNWTYDEIPEKYKKHIKIPKFDESYLDKPGNKFVASGDIGQCTELTWAYMNQLHGQGQPADDNTVTNGMRVYEVYKNQGAEVTNNPTVGYGFSSSPPYALATIPGVGHTGVVAGVMDDGKFIIAQYNVNPDPAPSRTVLYSVIDGVPEDAGNNLIFFSGIKKDKKK